VHRGHVSKLFHDKQYGLIRTESGSDALFNIHCLWDTQFTDLIEGQTVEFEVQTTHNGSLAFHIRPTATIL
jgi:cold shock CspA family protein